MSFLNENKKTLVGILVITSLISILSFSTSNPPTELPCQMISIGETRVRAEVAETDESRTQGLSSRIALPAGTGMLFVFERPGVYSFWMKDMNFPIDIIWINKERRVVGAVERALPESFPRTFMSSKSILYALEVPVGFVKNNKIIPESVVEFTDC